MVFDETKATRISDEKRKEKGFNSRYIDEKTKGNIFSCKCCVGLHSPATHERCLDASKNHHMVTTWFDMVILLYTNELWYQNFRVTKAAFTFILHEIQEEIYRQDTAMRKAISAQHRLA